jgi:hypothetical protein
MFCVASAERKIATSREALTQNALTFFLLQNGTTGETF